MAGVNQITMNSLSQWSTSMSFAASVLGSSILLIATGLYFNKSYQEKKNLVKFTAANVNYDVMEAEIAPQQGRVTVLITGGNGFLGGYIIDQMLKEECFNIIVLDICLPPKHKLKREITYIQGNLLSPDHLRQAVTIYLKHGISIDCIIHSASLIPYLGIPKRAVELVNVQGTRNVIAACEQHNISSVIYTSSATVILTKTDRSMLNMSENQGRYPLKDQHPDTYTTTKAEAERIVLSAHRPPSLATCVLRPAAIFGKGDKLIVDKLIKGEDLFVIGTGDSLLDYVPVECVANAHVLAVKAITSDKRAVVGGQVYNIGNGESKSYGWFNGLGTVGSAPNLSHWQVSHPVCLPLWLVDCLCFLNDTWFSISGMILLSPSLTHSLIDYTQRSYTFSIDKAMRDFGYAPLYSVSEKIAQLVSENRKQ